MRTYGTLLACFLGLGVLAPGFSKPVHPAQSKDGKNVNVKRIEQLVKQLGASRFAEREAAQKELEAIGPPVVEYFARSAKTVILR